MCADLIKSIPNIFEYEPRPKFSLTRHLHRFESVEEVERRRKSLLTALKRYRSDEQELIECLEECSKDAPCRLLCCPACMRVLRIWFCDQVAPFVATAPETFKSITLVPDRHRHGIGTLHTFKAQHLIDDFRTAVKKIGLKNVIVFGSIDYCEEVVRDRNGKYHRHWCPHLHLITNIPENEWNYLNVELRRYFPNTDNAKAPIKIVPLSSTDAEILKPVSYCVKMSFYSRYSESAPQIRAAPGNISYANNKKRPRKQHMHGKLKAELACLHAHHRFKDRIILIGLKHVQKSIVQTAKFSRVKSVSQA